MTYRLHPARGVILIESGEHIAPDKSDARWLAYREWVKAGGLPAPATVEEPPLADLVLQMQSRIDQERNHHHNMPITVGGIEFDADQDARENIVGTLSRLLRGDGLPPMWVGWRAADNSMHWGADTPETVLTSLRALASAIEDRKQAILIAAWIKKAEVATLNRTALAEYDIHAGWPA